jgi:hypothetical protein
VFTVAAVLGGTPGRRQKRLVNEAWRASGRPFRAGDLEAVSRSFIDGQGISGFPERPSAVTKMASSPSAWGEKNRTTSRS